MKKDEETHMGDQCIPAGISFYDQHRISKGISQVLSATGSNRAPGGRRASSSLLSSLSLWLLQLRAGLLWLPGVGAGLLGQGMDRLWLAADLAPGPLEVPLGGSACKVGVATLDMPFHED